MTMATKSDGLGSAVVAMCLTDLKRYAVLRHQLAAHEVPLGSAAYRDWLQKWGLSEVRTSRTSVTLRYAGSISAAPVAQQTRQTAAQTG